MIRAFRKAVRFLESPRLATWLLVFVGAWSVVATIVPQGDTVAAWAATHPLVEPVVRALDLHHAFSSLVFQVGVFVLAVSTALCAWRRTRVAFGRVRTLREAAARDGRSVVERHDFEVVCDGAVLPASAALSIASETLERLGVRTKRCGEMLTAVSPWWSVWGSPVFHWGLLAIVAVVLIGSLQRSQGLMGVPVGQTVADAPGAYGVLQAGPLHSWDSVNRSIRVDSFDEDYWAGGIDRGPTPVVSVLDGQGRVLGTQHIYPNNPLQVGSLTIHPAAFGFAVDLSLLNGKGVVSGHATKLVDISEVASEGTAPLGALTVSNQGQPQEQVIVTVPLRHDGTVWAVPELRSARLVVLTLNGKTMQDRVLKPGESIALPTGDTIRVDAVGFYARLSVVDDATIPFLYAAMALAVLGLALTVVSRQQEILVTASEEPEGLRVYASVHLWRNASTTRDEIRSELSRALHASDEEDVS